MHFLKFYYKLNTAVEITKKSKTDTVSAIVVRSGEAIIAGSSFNFLAKIGNIHPQSFASITVKINVNETTKAIFTS